MTSDPRRRRLPVGRGRLPGWQREALQTNLWVVPTAMVGLAVVLFAITHAIDDAANAGRLTLPGWMNSGDAGAGREILIGIAAAVITVAGVVFAITILALQLASQQFGPRVLRTFIRDVGTQVSLGAYVATFTFSVLTLASITEGSTPDFVPHLSITVALVFTLADLGVLIYFIHHVATSIQLTSVVAGIARDFRSTLNDLQEEMARSRSGTGSQLPLAVSRLDRDGAVVPTGTSGFLQAVGHDRLVAIAASSDATIRLLFRPGHFVVEGQPLAVVSPARAAAEVAEALAKEHIVGSSRTLSQDLGFAVDQLVEVAIRALSPAVNDTFTALNCIDWLGDCMCRAAVRPLPNGIYCDLDGVVRLIEPTITFERLVRGATDKIRQAGRGMPAVLIRQLENFRKVVTVPGGYQERAVILQEANMILRASEESVQDPSDRADVQRAYRVIVEDMEFDPSLPADVE